jgi:hypothetical protein
MCEYSEHVHACVHNDVVVLFVLTLLHDCVYVCVRVCTCACRAIVKHSSMLISEDDCRDSNDSGDEGECRSNSGSEDLSEGVSRGLSSASGSGSHHSLQHA